MAVAAAGFAFVAYLYLTLPDVRVLARTNPTRTAWMELREREAREEGRTLRHVHRWVPYARISPHLKRAVLVAEDDRFWQHEGIDLEAIRESIEFNMERGAAVRGASTITQQLAKNLYLSPSRDPFRKLRELIIARRMEAELDKARIFEIYLNVIEWGDGVWGADAAARTYFRTSAAGLGRQQAALLAGAIINPRVLNPGRPTARLLRRQRLILGRMGAVQPPTAAPRPAPIPDDLPDEEAVPEDVVDDEPLPPPGDVVPAPEPESPPVTDEVLPEPAPPPDAAPQ